MVCEWGMSEAVGPLTFGQKEEPIFLGRKIAQHQDDRAARFPFAQSGNSATD